MPTITAKVSDELLAYIDLVSGGNRSEYLRRCLEAGPGDLESGLKIVTNQLSDVNGEPAEFGKNRTLRFSGHP